MKYGRKRICKSCKWKFKDSAWHIRQGAVVTKEDCNLRRVKRW